MTDELKNKLKVRGKSRVVLTREGSTIEFKENFDWNNREDYALVISSFANNVGGYLVFGISDKPRLLEGLKDRGFENLDEGRLTEYLNSYFSPEISYIKTVEKFRGIQLGVIYVNPLKEKPVIAIKNGSLKGIKEGAIYYRYNARTETIKYPELRSLIQQIQENERSDWKKLLSSLAKLAIPTSLATSAEDIAENSKGMPVYLTHNPNTPAVHVEDKEFFTKFPLDYNRLVRSLKSRYKDLVINRRFHSIRKNLMRDISLSQPRSLNPLNEKSSHQDFYSNKIITKFDKFYQKK